MRRARSAPPAGCRWRIGNGGRLRGRERTRPAPRIFAESAGSGAVAGSGPQNVVWFRTIAKTAVRHTRTTPAIRQWNRNERRDSIAGRRARSALDCDDPSAKTPDPNQALAAGPFVRLLAAGGKPEATPRTGSSGWTAVSRPCQTSCPRPGRRKTFPPRAAPVAWPTSPEHQVDRRALGFHHPRGPLPELRWDRAGADPGNQ